MFCLLLFRIYCDYLLRCPPVSVQHSHCLSFDRHWTFWFFLTNKDNRVLLCRVSHQLSQDFTCPHTAFTRQTINFTTAIHSLQIVKHRVYRSFMPRLQMECCVELE